MSKFIPKEKLSKKKRKEQDSQQRNDWGEVRPITRIIPSRKAYNRGKEKRKAREYDD